MANVLANAEDARNNSISLVQRTVRGIIELLDCLPEQFSPNLRLVASGLHLAGVSCTPYLISSYFLLRRGLDKGETECLNQAVGCLKLLPQLVDIQNISEQTNLRRYGLRAPILTKNDIPPH